MTLLGSDLPAPGATAAIPNSPIQFGDLDRTLPISRKFGFDRGTCIDRVYIERFLAENAGDIAGRVLEVGDDEYTRKFGSDRITKSDILHVEGTRRTTLVGNLETGEGIPDAAFDCAILTQTFHHIFDVASALRSACRLLAPGGVMLTTVPGISQISRFDMDRWGDYWRFTTKSLERLVAATFPRAEIEVRSRGNVYAAVCLLHGLAAEEIDARKLHDDDEDYQVLLTVRACKSK